MNPPITPALTPEEWESKELAWPTVALSTTGDKGELSVWDGELDDDSHFVKVKDSDRHSLAALALHGQPFGFTHEDVALLREEAEGEWNGAHMEQGRKLLVLAARIEALLPPEVK